MNDPKQRLDELPDGLNEIVAGINAEPVPDDLKDRVRSRLQQQPSSTIDPETTRTHANFTVTISLGVAAVAAFILIGPLLWLRSESNPPDQPPHPPAPDLPVVEVIEDGPGVARVEAVAEGPTLWAYRRAADSDPDRLDVLLGKHASMVLATDHSVERTRPSTAPSLLEEI